MKPENRTFSKSMYEQLCNKTDKKIRKKLTDYIIKKRKERDISKKIKKIRRVKAAKYLIRKRRDMLKLLSREIEKDIRTIGNCDHRDYRVFVSQVDCYYREICFLSCILNELS